MRHRRTLRRTLRFAAVAIALTAAVPGPAVANTGASDAVALQDDEPPTIDGNEPEPIDGSERHWDFTGDGRVSHADVPEFFAHHFYPEIRERPSRFDYNRNGVVGHGDVKRLFRVVATGHDRWNASIVDAPAEVHAGDRASVELDLDGLSRAWVTLRQDGGDYQATVSLDDVAHDGDVALRVNTAELANGTPTSAFSASGATVNATATTESGTLEQSNPVSPDAAPLEVGVATGGPTAPPGDVTTVELVPGSIGPVTPLIAPANATLSTPAEIRAQTSSAEIHAQWPAEFPSWLGLGHAVARDDHLVLAVNASGVYGSFPTETAQFDEGSVDVELFGPNPGLGSPPGGSVGEFATNHTRVVPSPERERFYVVVDSRALRNSAGGFVEVWSALALRHGSATPLLPDGVAQRADGTFRADSRRVTFDDQQTVYDGVAVAPTANATVRARTTVAPGTAATVEVQIGEETRSRTTTVGPNRTLAATFDLSDREPGGAIERVRVAEAGGATAESRGVLVPPSELLRDGVVVNVSAPDTASVGENATIAVTLRNPSGPGGYAPARIEIETDAYRPVEGTWTTGDENGTVDVVFPYLESGETWTARYHFEETDARSVGWSVEAGGKRPFGTVVVEES